MDLESQRGIRHGLEDSRRDGLTRFIEELVPIIISEGYTIEDLLHALANWTSNKPQLKQVSRHLEDATQSISNIT